MRRKTHEEVKKIFELHGCELLEKEYKNNAIKMSFTCKCGKTSNITLNQFNKNPQCYDCGLEQMRKSKDKGQQPCRACESTSDMMDRKEHGNICRECYNKTHREHRRKNRHKYFNLEKHIEYQKTVPLEYKRYHVNKSYYKARLAAMKNYSPDLCCQECGFDSHLSALSIDHIDGNGANHRRELNGKNIVYWLKDNSYPDGFQVLCMNCNFIKAWENKEYN